MSNDTVRIDPSKVNKAGQAIIADAKTMYTALDNIKNIINNTKSFFKSEGADTARNNFNASAEKFATFKSGIESYGSFLCSYGGAVSNIDDKIKEIASQFNKG